MTCRIHSVCHIFGKCSRNSTFYVQHSVSFLLHVMTLSLSLPHVHMHTKCCSNFAAPEYALQLCQFSTTFADCVYGLYFFRRVVRMHTTDSIKTQIQDSNKTKNWVAYKITTTFIVLIYELVTFIGTHLVFIFHFSSKSFEFPM